MSERRRNRLNAAERREMRIAQARATLAECVIPGCGFQTFGPTGLCIHCASFVVNYWDDQKDELDADLSREAMRERRVQKRLREMHEETRARESRRQQPGWIYYLLIDGRIKIGYSADVKRRLKAYPPDTPLLALHPGTKELEGELHRQFVGCRAAGREWFLDVPEIREHIKQVIAQFGEPDRARYEHRGQRANPRLKAS